MLRSMAMFMLCKNTGRPSTSCSNRAISGPLPASCTSRSLALDRFSGQLVTVLDTAQRRLPLARASRKPLSWPSRPMTKTVPPACCEAGEPKRRSASAVAQTAPSDFLRSASRRRPAHHKQPQEDSRSNPLTCHRLILAEWFWYFGYPLLSSLSTSEMDATDWGSAKHIVPHLMYFCTQSLTILMTSHSSRRRSRWRCKTAVSSRNAAAAAGPASSGLHQLEPATRHAPT